MNLEKLFKLQKELDDHIEKIHPRQEGEDRLAKKILALQVELAECAQESRCFKFWSEDQKARTKEFCEICCGVGVYIGDDYSVYDPCFRCNGTGFSEKNPLLEEYVDCLHFILSIGLDIGVCPEELDAEPISCANVTEQFIDLFYEASHLRYEESNGRLYEDYLQYNIVLERFVGLGEMLGFTWDEIERAYYAKNKENHERQENGY